MNYRSEEHTYVLQSPNPIADAVFLSKRTRRFYTGFYNSQKSQKESGADDSADLTEPAPANKGLIQQFAKKYFLNQKSA